MIVLGNEKKCIYLPNPKTGSTTVREIIRYTNEKYYYNTLKFNKDLYHDPDYHPHYNYSDMKLFLKKYKINLDECYTYTTIRNPWARLVSFYRYAGYDKNGIPQWHDNYDESTAYQYSFENFIKYFKVEKNSVVPIDQYAFDKDGKQLVNKIFILESLNLKEMMCCLHSNCNIEYEETLLKYYLSGYSKLKMPLIMPTIKNKNVNNDSSFKNSYKIFYTEQWMIDKVATIFRKDIEIGNYIF